MPWADEPFALGCRAVRPGLTNLSDQTDQSTEPTGWRDCGWPAHVDRKLFLQMAVVLTSASSFVVKNAVICKEGRSMRHLFLMRSISGVLKCLGGLGAVSGEPGVAWSGVCRELPLREFANGGRFDHQIVLRGQKRHHSQWGRSVGACRCSSMFVDVRRRSRFLLWGAIVVFAAACRPLLFCACRRYTMVQIKKRCSKRCRPSGIRRSDYGRRRVHGKLR